MQIYKTFFKLTLRNISSCIIYLVFAVILSLIIAKVNADSPQVSFEPKKIAIDFIDRDNTDMSQALFDYLDTIHNVNIKDDNDQLAKDDLFYHITEYIVIVESGFQDKILSGDFTDAITTYENPDSNSAYIIKSQIESYLDNINSCLKSGYGIDDSIKKADEASTISADVTLPDKRKIAAPVAMLYFYTFMPYVAMFVFINVLGPMLLLWNKREIKERTIVSSTTIVSRNIQIIAAVLTCFLSIFVLFTLCASVIYRADFFTLKGAYLTFNLFAYMLVCLATAFLIAQLIKTQLLLSVWSNIIGLGTSFFCGVFVNRSFLPVKLISFSKCLPTYWYINITEELRYSDGLLSSEGWRSLLVQLIYAIALFVAAIVVTKYKEQRSC